MKIIKKKHTLPIKLFDGFLTSFAFFDFPNFDNCSEFVFSSTCLTYKI